MNNEAVSSIVVVDNHMNVIGNISTTDVKVCKQHLHHSTSNVSLAPHTVVVTAASPKYLHSLYLCDSVHPWPD